MKKITIGLLILWFANHISGQTNTFPSSGNVGIGTTSPGWPLQIGNLYSGSNGAINGATNPHRLIINSGLSESALTLGYYSAGYGFDLWVGTTGLAPVYFDNRNSDAFIFRNNAYYSSPNELMRITGSGIGIGTSVPGKKLEVYTGANDGIRINATDVPRLDFYLNAVSQTQKFWSFASTNLSVGDFGLYQSTSIGSDPVSGTARMYFTSAGNAGIGTTSPSEKLSVNGNIKAQKIIVTQTGWSDYVFNKDYKLRNLRDLETFINKNKHLPEVPTAKEVAAKGISVGDNQVLLLKKIEELTLYMIEMNKTNDQMKAEIKVQAKEIKLLKQMNKR